MSLAAVILAGAVLTGGGDAECAVLAAAAALLRDTQEFSSGDVSQTALPTRTLAPPSGGPNEFKGLRMTSGRRDLAECPGWIAQAKANGWTLAAPSRRQLTYPGPSNLRWFSRPAFSRDGRTARVIFGSGGRWGGVILDLRLTETGWVADDERTLFVTTD
ncbi:hypothetical protein QO010_003448 [Caulobacter ginsengisoli]|uniref:Pilus assembly protein n=1 Tax=Caulobacter ginsengisoli TaxID=400775 RepID=A0ABU0IX84_9CAUL|nr:hypothetical protein [Caulobacter ginsengisoli]MDQ0465659.1 hypothetical protein [Caulobacter ginsengisoli]